MKINCTSNYLISTEALFGSSIDVLKKSENEQNCLGFSNKMNLDLSHCDLTQNLKSKMEKNYCKGNSTCDVDFLISDVFQNCTNNILFDTLYLSYSCYGEYIRFYFNYHIILESYVII